MDDYIAVYLYDIKKAIEEVESYFYAYPMRYDVFEKDYLRRSAVERKAEIMGEAINRILKIQRDFPLPNARYPQPHNTWLRLGETGFSMEPGDPSHPGIEKRCGTPHRRIRHITRHITITLLPWPPTIIVHCVRHGGISFRYIGVCPCNKLVTNKVITKKVIANKVIALGKYVIIKCITEAL